MLMEPEKRVNREGDVSVTRVIGLLILALQVLAIPAGAQTRVDIVPSATIGSIYDNNLFAKTNSTAGQMMVLTPGFLGTMKSPRFDLATDLAFDAQRSNFATLNTVDARRHAMLDIHYK